jgi:DNA replication initiation complex subunit (GINS family)
MEPMITYETISSVHRAEKGLQLSKLPDGFFPAVQLWLSHKKSRGDAHSILEAENARKLLEYIVNIRLRKIITAALDSARGSAPPSNMTVDESAFFDKILLTVKAQQNEMKERLFGAGFLIEQKVEEARKSLEEMKSATAPAVERGRADFNAQPKTPANSAPVEKPAVAIEKPVESKTETSQPILTDQKPLKPLNSTKKVRILRELSRFVDANGSHYGPFKSGDVTDVPEDVFKMLSMSHAVEPAM